MLSPVLKHAIMLWHMMPGGLQRRLGPTLVLPTIPTGSPHCTCMHGLSSMNACIVSAPRCATTPLVPACALARLKCPQLMLVMLDVQHTPLLVRQCARWHQAGASLAVAHLVFCLSSQLMHQNAWPPQQPGCRHYGTPSCALLSGSHAQHDALYLIAQSMLRLSRGDHCTGVCAGLCHTAASLVLFRPQTHAA